MIDHTEFSAFVTGLVIGVVLMCSVLAFSSSSYYNIVTKAREECEQSLPRTQHCKIIAIPEETK